LVVHDLKNPLSVVLANLAFAVEELRHADGLVDPDVGQALVESQEAGRRLLRLITNLGDTARMEASRLPTAAETVAVGGLLRQIAAQRRVIAGAREIRVAVHVPAEIEATVDADLLTRAIENVVDNALRYVSSGGNIVLSATRLGDDFEVAIGND